MRNFICLFLWSKLQIVGPFANNPVQQLGSYSPGIDMNFTTTPATELSALGEESVVVAGCVETHCVFYDSTAVISAVKHADLTFLCLGTGIINIQISALNHFAITYLIQY